MAIPRELLKKIRKIEIFTSKLVNDQLAGQYQSVFKGRGMAFSEVRQYQAGDDVRLIDWNVSARMNEPFVKIFVEEREMTVILLVDMSASGLFGSRASGRSASWSPTSSPTAGCSRCASRRAATTWCRWSSPIPWRRSSPTWA